jgi:hypothetical protein
VRQALVEAGQKELETRGAPPFPFRRPSLHAPTLFRHTRAHPARQEVNQNKAAKVHRAEAGPRATPALKAACCALCEERRERANANCARDGPYILVYYGKMLPSNLLPQ